MQSDKRTTNQLVGALIGRIICFALAALALKTAMASHHGYYQALMYVVSAYFTLRSAQD